ncbi:MAG: superoxide dismutase [Lentimicrobium sp.]|nr:superoxide dismutase [Lentimicrobium sp.]
MKNIFIAMLFMSGTMLLPGNLLAQKTMTSKSQSKDKSSNIKKTVDVSKETATLSATAVSEAFTGKAEDWFMPAAETTFPALPYSYSALEPVIDKMTVELHYDKHHRGYFNNFKKAIANSKMEKMSMYEIFSGISEQSATVRNNAGGYFNHVIYWSNLSPEGGGEPSGILLKHIINSFGSYEGFVKEMTEAAKTRFGSGWAWLAVDLKTKELFITSTANQDNPLMDISDRRGYPILALDVWEHAYYLNYQNKRADYIDSFWKKVNWKDVQTRFDAFDKIAGKLQ